MTATASTQHVALVTGANRGIGLAIARALLGAGHKVACGYRSDKGGIAQLEQEFPTAFAVQLDILKRESVKDAVAAAAKHFGEPIDIVVNNAGIADERPFEEITNEQWDAMLATNLRGAFIVAQETLGAMRKQKWGRFVNITSIGGQWGGMRQVHYAAAKAGIISLTHSLSKMYAAEGITANAVSPGLIKTDMTAAELASGDGKAKAASIPVGRIGTPEDVAASVRFLASDDASYITGQTLNVNGGLLFS